MGRRPPAWLIERTAGLAGVELHADVPDVRPFLSRASLMIVPLRIGGGSRLKILEALATGLPVVSTTVGAEGLALRHAHELILADEPVPMAEAVAEVLKNPVAAAEIAERGRQVVLANYDWDVLADKLEEVWNKCLQPC